MKAAYFARHTISESLLTPTGSSRSPNTYHCASKNMAFPFSLLKQTRLLTAPGSVFVSRAGEVRTNAKNLSKSSRHSTLTFDTE